MKPAQQLFGLRGAVAVLATGLAGTVSLQAPVVAADPASNPASGLCRDSKVSCSVQAPTTWAEGETHSVSVTGSPRTRVRLRAHRLVAKDGAPSWAAIGDPLILTTDKRGYGDADLTLPTLPSGTAGGPVLIAVDGSDLADLTTVLGAWTTLTAQTPIVRGDGWGPAKPVGQDLALRIEAGARRTAYDVELDDGSGWTSVGTSTQRTCAASVSCDVTYQLPRGLAPRTYTVRLVNLSTGTPVAAWKAKPSEAPVEAARSTALAVGAVGSAVPGATVQRLGASTDPVRRARSANLELPEGARVASDASSEASQHPADLARAVTLAATLLAAVAALAMLRRRRA